jgi:hypothetical protein
MKYRTAFLALLLAPVLAFAENAAVKTDTPSEVLKKFIKAAFKDRDYETAMTLSHGGQKDFIRMMAKSMAYWQKAAAAGDAEAKAKLAGIEAKSARFTFEITKESIDGDLAVVSAVWKIDGKTKTDFAFFMKVDGAWKCIGPEDYFKALKARNGGK